MLTCNICLKSFPFWLNYHKHLRAHKFKHSTFYCFYHNCSEFFNNFSSYLSHVYRKHIKTKTYIKIKNTCESRTSPCYNCNKSFSNTLNLIKHVILHIKSDSFLFCPLNNCKSRFINETSFRSHLKRNHNFYFKSNILFSKHHKKSVLNESSREISNVFINPCNSPNNSSTTESVQANTENKPNLQYELAFLFHTLKYVHNIPKRVIQEISDKMCHIHSNCENELLSKIENISQEFDLAPPIIDSLKKSVSLTLQPERLNLRTDYHREKIFSNIFQFITPQKIYLGKNNYNKDCYYYYVPVLKSLSKLLEEEEIFNQIYNQVSQLNPIDSVSDYQDGLAYKKNIFLNERPRIDLILYADAFEIVNPLGSAKKKYKTLGVYYTLGNIVPHERLKTKNMQLAILCFNSHVNLFTLDVILDKLVNDIIILENRGIFVDRKKRFLKGTIYVILGDNLGSHQLGGFIENFSSAEYFCRYCLIKKNEFKQYPQNIGIKRSVQNYNDATEKIVIDGKPYEGIKSNSPFNKCKFFQIAQPGLPPCIAHDIYEGFLAYDLMLFIKYFVSEKWFSFQSLNNNISSIQKKIKFSTSFPLLNSKQIKLPGHAIQNYEFCIMFPLVIYFMSKSSTNINFQNPVWKLFICLLEIVQICSAHQITFNQINYLQYSSQFYVVELKNLFHNYNLRPKHHYLLHYPDLIREFGPLVKLSTLRFESKHQFFKVIAKAVNNFNNILHTLTMRHQHFQSSLFDKRFEKDSVVVFKKSFISREFRDILCPLNYKFSSLKVKYRNVEYKRDQFLAVQRDDECKVLIIKIKYIFITNNFSDILFYGYLFKMEYDKSHGLHIIVNTNPKTCFVPFKSILNPFPFTATCISNETLTSLKQFIHF